MNYKYDAMKLVFFGFMAASIAGCKKDFQEKIPQRRIDENHVFRKPETAGEKNLVANLGQVTELLKEIYKSKELVKEVNAAIYAGVYTDESILLRDLVFPEKGLLSQSGRFKELATQWRFTPGAFSRAFLQAAERKKDPLLNSFIQAMGASPGQRSAEYLEEQVSIYYPYSDEFLEPVFEGYGSTITTLVTATADADEGWGYLTSYDPYGTPQYQQVLVDDAYVFANPTHIIGVNGIEPVVTAPTTVHVFHPSGPVDIPDLTREVKQVYIGEVRCSQQFDRLISFSGNGGGSEIRFTRADGFLKYVDGQVQADMFIINGPYKIERGDIRDGGSWIDWTAVWDNDWEGPNFEQNLAIYEEDNRNSGSFSGSLKTTVKINSSITAEGSIGFTLNFKSDDPLIFQMNYKHDVFFALNRFDQEGELRNGWPVRNKNGSVSFTFLDRTLY
jgi:hypothetical protein